MNATQYTAAQRDQRIDIMKGLLVVGMLASHVNVFYGKPSVATTVLKYYVNSISFSGFLFCFGYAVYVAYIRRYTRTTPLRILSGAAKIFGVFVLSSSTYSIFRDKTYGWERFLDILTVQYIPLYNEFLLSFALYYVLTIILVEPFRWATANWQRVLGVIVLCCIPTIVPSPITGLVGSIVWGVPGQYLFPILPYAPFFIIGMVFARHTSIPHRWLWGVAICATLISVGYIMVAQATPQRFPPSIWWLLGPVLPLTVYYVLSGYAFLQQSAFGRWLAHIGENVLFYLLMSNVLLFVFTRMKYGFSVLQSMIVTVGMLGIIWFLTIIVRPNSMLRQRD